MKLKKLQKRLAVESLVVLGVTGLCFGLFWFMMEHAENIEEKLQKEERMRIQVMRSTVEKQEEYERVLKSFDTYKIIPSAKLPTNNVMATTAARIRAARPLVESMKDKFFMSSIDITFSNIEAVKEQMGKNTFDVYTNSMNVTMESYTDSHVYAFLSALEDIFPGYLMLEDLQIDGKGTFQPNTIEKIRSGEIKSMAKAEARFSWKVLKGNEEAAKK